MNRHRVIVREGKNLGESIAEIFRLLGFVGLATKKVLVKPNMLRAARPEECIVTSPLLVSETVTFLTTAGAEVMVGDNPAPHSTSWVDNTIAEYCGFVNASGNRWRNIGMYSRKVKKPKNLLKEFYVSREIFDCDLLVSLPKYKGHELTTMSLAIKNHFGIVPGGFKPYVHALFPRIEDFSEILVEIYEARPADVVVVDCLDVVDARGKVHHPGVVIAGDNGHAVDYACALMADIDPLRVPTIKCAHDRRLFDPQKIEFNGTLSRIHGFSLPIVFPFRNSIVEFISRILYRIWLARVPVIDPAVCIRCLSCKYVCPPRAINGHYIDYSKCIECYCCLEVCPSGAIRTRFKFA